MRDPEYSLKSPARKSSKYFSEFPNRFGVKYLDKNRILQEDPPQKGRFCGASALKAPKLSALVQIPNCRHS